MLQVLQSVGGVFTAILGAAVPVTVAPCSWRAGTGNPNAWSLIACGRRLRWHIGIVIGMFPLILTVLNRDFSTPPPPLIIPINKELLV